MTLTALRWCLVLLHELRVAVHNGEVSDGGRQQWYALWTHSHCEQLVSSQLATSGFELFLPRVGVWSWQTGVSPFGLAIGSHPERHFCSSHPESPAGESGITWTIRSRTRQFPSRTDLSSLTSVTLANTGGKDYR